MKYFVDRKQRIHLKHYCYRYLLIWLIIFAYSHFFPSCTEKDGYLTDILVSYPVTRFKEKCVEFYISILFTSAHIFYIWICIPNIRNPQSCQNKWASTIELWNLVEFIFNGIQAYLISAAPRSILILNQFLVISSFSSLPMISLVLYTFLENSWRIVISPSHITFPPPQEFS